jgi:hypothetical protein
MWGGIAIDRVLSTPPYFGRTVAGLVVEGAVVGGGAGAAVTVGEGLEVVVAGEGVWPQAAMSMPATTISDRTKYTPRPIFLILFSLDQLFQ